VYEPGLTNAMRFPVIEEGRDVAGWPLAEPRKSCRKAAVRAEQDETRLWVSEA
jgi:hypothetical protein